jgi:predicted DNA-binding transcriptional regulator AlpA
MRPTPRLLSPRVATERTSLSVRHLARLSKLGQFPAEVWLGDARKAYPEDEVEQWINARIAERAVAAALAPVNGAQHADQHEQDLPAAPMPSAAPHSAAAPLKRPRSRPPPGI